MTASSFAGTAGSATSERRLQVVVDATSLASLYALLSPILVVRGLLPYPIGAIDVLAPLGLAVVLREPYRMIRAPIGPYLVTISGLLVVSVVRGASALETLRLFLTFLPFAVVFLHASKRPSRVTTAAFIGGFLGVTVSMLLMALGIQMEGAQQEIYVAGQGSIQRAGGLLGNSGSLGHLAAAWLLFVLVYVGPRAGRGQVRGLLGRPSMVAVAVIPGVLALTVSSSRAGFLHVLVGAAVWAMVALRPGRGGPSPTRPWVARLVLLVAIGLPAVAVATSQLLGSVFAEKALSRLNPFATGSGADFYRSAGRLESWSALFEDYWSLPFTGLGYESGGSAGRLLLDNSYLTVLLSGGVLALLAYLAFWGSCVKLALGAPRPVRAAALALIAGQFVHGFFGDTLAMWYSMGYGFVLLGIVLADAYSQRAPAEPYPAPPAPELGADLFPHPPALSRHAPALSHPASLASRETGPDTWWLEQ